MWPSTRLASDTSRSASEKTCNSAMPMTTPGSTSGDMTTAEASPCSAGGKCRSARLVTTPRTEAPMDARAATITLMRKESRNSTRPNATANQVSVKPCGGKLTYRISDTDEARIASDGSRMKQAPR